MLAESSQTPLVAKIVLLSVLILDESLILLVNRVVGQMHIFVILIDLLRIGFRGKTS